VLTVADLVFGNLALLLDIETANKHMPLALPSSWSSDTYLSRRWRRKTLDSCDTHNILAYLLHLDVRDIGRNITVIVQWSLDLV